MTKLISRSLDEVKVAGSNLDPTMLFSLADFVAEAKSAGQLDAASRGCVFTVMAVDATLAVEANRELMLAALANLLNNAFKFTHPKTEVTLTAYALGARILIEVKDKCGGLPPGNADRMFIPFSQRGDDKTGVGLGLSIARQSVMADGGTLSVKNFPGDGCVFTIDIPRRVLH